LRSIEQQPYVYLKTPSAVLIAINQITGLRIDRPALNLGYRSVSARHIQTPSSAGRSSLPLHVAMASMLCCAGQLVWQNRMNVTTKEFGSVLRDFTYSGHVAF
jgi:hypothetical protein